MAVPCLAQSYSSSSGPSPTINITPTCRSGTPGTLSFNGGGSLQSAPDTATVSVSIDGNGTSASEAQQMAADAAVAVLGNLTDVNGIESDDISTTSVSVSPQTNYNSVTGNSEPDGFAFQNSIQVTVNNVTSDLLAEVLDSIVSSGGNLATISGVSLSLSDNLTNTLTNRARREAVLQAKQVATLYTQALDVTLGGLLAFTDNSVSYSQSSSSATPSAQSNSFAASSAEAARSTPVQLGTQSVSVSVNLVYSICSSNTA
ncbi:hypothetical protein WJX73_003114 [Symbiochloris irregularis]|uniref:DUF541 domain-containing protein n=1 Tax=Symbiochloris irregularis TaxID=706552 RepID=A0AAW1NRB5_9CHLO